MDLFTTNNTTTVSRDTEIDTPPLTLKPLTYAKGSHKHRSRLYSASPIYHECLRNHAASIGGHALDGCGEFMPATPVLTCAACGCHRNFHRREERQVISPESSPSPSPSPPLHILHHSPTSSPSPYPAQISYHLPHHYPVLPTKMLLALSKAVGEEHVNIARAPSPETPKGENGNSRERKRFRTKFSKEQKDEMLSFSEKLGWKMARADDMAVDAFCAKIGVAKGVLKVWMHNNKNTFAKKGSNLAINELSLSNNDVSIGIRANVTISNQQNESNNGSSSSA